MDGLSWQTIIDQQWIDNFSWRAAPLSDVRVVAATAAAYVALALLAKRRADARPKPSPPGPSYLLAAHSLVLCAASYVMCRGAVKASLARGASEGWGWFFCETQTEAPRLYYYACASARWKSETTRPPRLASTDYPRRGRGVAATRLHGLSTSRPRR